MLRAVEKPEPLDEVLDDWMARSAGVDHFEFYWFPHTEIALTKTNSRLPLDVEPRRQSAMTRWVDDELLSNGVFQLTCALNRMVPPLVGPINRLAQRLVAEREIIDHSYAVFTAPRRVRFREMEYAIPAEKVPDALRAIQALIAHRGWRISFPVEVRVAAPDENWLSTAHGRLTGYIAVHRYVGEDPTAYFTEVEAIMREFDGRPHWGKMNFRSADDLRPSYPRFDDFLGVRDELDPQRRFANPYLARVLGS
jgi:FAD/FMN-containing dehydrogenase